MFRYLILGLLVTAGLIGGQLYLSKSNNSQQPTIEVSELRSEAASTAVDATFRAMVAKRDPIANQPVSVASEFSSKQNSALVDPSAQAQKDRPWSENESPSEMPIRYANRGIDARPLKIDKQQLAQITRGDTIKLSVPQNGLDYEMSVREVGRHANGDKSLKGYLTKNPEFTVVMTEGRTATFATINTPEGSFLLEASGDEGWMLSLAELDNLVDPNLVDYQIPDISR